MTGEPMYTTSKDKMVPALMPQLSIADLKVKWEVHDACIVHTVVCQKAPVGLK